MKRFSNRNKRKLVSNPQRISTNSTMVYQKATLLDVFQTLKGSLQTLYCIILFFGI
ncbi:MAG: hypothetical protein MjAS7_2007 [Metallosphaera javensis (ex Sakai et al. 2022)]|nr:MAG: hypothetical protein MjAS7_2007 [Metallosphaera javensis (ex Sakai et al. 2022)]